MLPRRPAKNRGGGELLRGPASHFPAMRHFARMLKKQESAVDHRVRLQKKSEARGCLDWPNRPSVTGSFVAAGLVWRDELLHRPPLLTLGHHVRACTNQATALLLEPS